LINSEPNDEPYGDVNPSLGLLTAPSPEEA
jgi:hypothetical protein